ncbi:MAG TPA: hypothetical protein VLA89_03235 [Gemmatimonadales bacterium]|nr:hypothetical protein [Gemmatimonadales bacterium]
MTVPNRTDFVLTEVELERARQDNLWGEQNHAPLVWLPILLEEVGEVAEALNKWNHCGDLEKAVKAMKEYREELVQVAAVAVVAVEAFDRAYGGER